MQTVRTDLTTHGFTKILMPILTLINPYCQFSGLGISGRDFMKSVFNLVLVNDIIKSCYDKATSYCLSQRWPSSLSTHDVIRPPWLNSSSADKFTEKTYASPKLNFHIQPASIVPLNRCPHCLNVPCRQSWFRPFEYGFKISTHI